MNDDDEEETLSEEYGEEEYQGGFLRWMSILVVLVAVAGFFALAYYAYHTGTQSINEGDVTLIEADNSPLKEAPVDPGGLQVPHQDKTVYEVISPSQPGDKPSAERILPEPEEPVKLNADADTQTWVNKPADAASGSDNTKPVLETVQEVEMVKSTPPDAVNAAPGAGNNASQPKVIIIDPATGKTTESVPAEKPVTVIPVPPEEKPIAATEEKKDLPKEVVRKEQETKNASLKSAGGTKVQLGAFKSQQEAEDTWLKIYKAHGEIIGSREHIISRADLGNKGIYYRLQLSGFTDVQAAKALCAKLSARKQGCFIAKAG